MRRFIVAPLIAALLALAAFVAPVGAITGGQPDGDGHPQVALLLFPGMTFCSGTLIGERTILTAGHCTSGWTELAADPDVEFDGDILVSFDSQASVDEDWLPDGGTWYTASSWMTHPDYVEADWPYTYDYGLLYLDTDQVLPDIEPATLAAPGTLDPVINDDGQSPDLFDDVGYGIQGKTIGGGPPLADITWTAQDRGPDRGARQRVRRRARPRDLVHHEEQPVREKGRRRAVVTPARRSSCTTRPRSWPSTPAAIGSATRVSSAAGSRR